jgi:flavin-dependent dehydrogenase
MPILSLKIVTPGGRSMVLTSNVAAVILLRRDFDNLLVQRAREVGVAFHGSAHATGLVREGDRVIGVRSADGREWRARFVLCADGAHSIFSTDPRPKRSISALMGWWEGAEIVTGQIEMIFDRNVAPLYGWLFPETPSRVNIGICLDGQDEDGRKIDRNIRAVFEQFLEDHYAERLSKAHQLGKWKGHPIVFNTWIGHCAVPGALFLGEAARVTHNATGEGISQAMQSGIFAADAVTSVLSGRVAENEAWRGYARVHRRRFTAGFLAGHALRAVIRSPLLDGIAAAYNNPFIRRGAVRLLGSALAGSTVKDGG